MLSGCGVDKKKCFDILFMVGVVFLLNRLKKLAAFQNPEFYRTQALRLSTYNKPRVIGCSEEFPDHLGLPRGCLLNIVEFLLLVRLVLRFLAANPASGFVNFIYQITAPLVSPFIGIIRPWASDGSVIEWSTIIAMFAYSIVAYILARIIYMVTRPRYY